MDRNDGYVKRYGIFTGNRAIRGVTGNRVDHAGEPFAAIHYRWHVSRVSVRGGWCLRGIRCVSESGGKGG